MGHSVVTKLPRSQDANKMSLILNLFLVSIIALLHACEASQGIRGICLEIVVRVCQMVVAAARACAKEAVVVGIRMDFGGTRTHARPTICLGDRLTAIAKNEPPPTWCNACCCCGEKITHWFSPFPLRPH